MTTPLASPSALDRVRAAKAKLLAKWQTEEGRILGAVGITGHPDKGGYALSVSLQESGWEDRIPQTFEGYAVVTQFVGTIHPAS